MRLASRFPADLAVSPIVNDFQMSDNEGDLLVTVANRSQPLLFSGETRRAALRGRSSLERSATD